MSEFNHEAILQQLIDLNNQEDDYWNSATSITEKIVQVYGNSQKLRAENEALKTSVEEKEKQINQHTEQAELIGRIDSLRTDIKTCERKYSNEIDQNLAYLRQITALKSEVEPLEVEIESQLQRKLCLEKTVEDKKIKIEQATSYFESSNLILTDLTTKYGLLLEERTKLEDQLFRLRTKEANIRNDQMLMERSTMSENPISGVDLSKFKAPLPSQTSKKGMTLNTRSDVTSNESIDNSFDTLHTNLFEKLKQNSLDKLHSGPVSCICYANTNPIIATGGQDCTVKILRSDNFRRLSSFAQATKSIMAMSFSPSDNLFLSASFDSTIRIYRLPNFTFALNFSDNRDCVNDAKFIADDEIISCSRDQTIKLYDVTKASLIKSFTSSSMPISLTYSQSQVVSGHYDGKLRIWDFRSPSAPVEIRAHKDIIIQCQSKTNSSNIVSLGQDKAIVVSDIRNPQDPFKGSINISKSGIPSEHMQMSLTDDFVYVGGSDGQLYEYSMETWKYHNSRKGHEAPVFCVAAKPSLGIMASGDRVGKVLFWKKDIKSPQYSSE